MLVSISFDLIPDDDNSKLIMASLCSSCLMIRFRTSFQQFHNSSLIFYREDYIKLGVAENATKEEIKAAYFERAKKLHPDSHGTTKVTENEFLELNESYKRLMYESRHGADSFDKTDPRNDPRTREYWDIRRRTQSKEEIDLEKAFNNKNRVKEQTLIRKMMLGLALGVFFGTIFPAVMLGADTETYYRDGCDCDNCILGESEKE